jgi:general secretion pathway protein D
MSTSNRNHRRRSVHAKLLLLAAFVVTCAMIGSLTYAVHEPEKSDNPRKTQVRLTASQSASSGQGTNTSTNNSQVTKRQRTSSNGQSTSSKVQPSSATKSRGEMGAAFRITDLQQQVETLPIPTKRLELIEFEDVPLSEAMRLFAEQSGLNVITSTEAGKTKVTVYLKNVTPIDALEAMVKANGLFYRIETNSGIVRIATLQEYEKDLSSFREEQTRVFTLLYPNPSAVAQVIKQVFGDRVQLNRADAEVEDLVDLSQRFSRFDLVDGRSLGLGSHSANSGSRSSQNSNPFGGLGQQANALTAGGLGGNSSNFGNFNNQNSQQRTSPRVQDSLRNMSADQIQQLENEIAEKGQLTEQVQADLMQRREATIYVSTIRRNNQVIVRTGDARSMEQIATLVLQLDVPTPTVLLEVKVLRVVLADGFNSAFEYLGGISKSATAFSDGSLSPTFPGGSSVAQQLGNGLGVAGNVPGALTFQVVDKSFRTRMQLLESKNCVTALATPLILTANNEVSRIFVGDTLPFTVGFTPSQVLSSVGAVNGAVAATPVTELRDVGQSLLITPNINADRTVTLRIVEENSERVVGGSSIPVPATSGSGVTNISVDTVRRRTISGTVVAQDGNAVALGGMIEEHASDSRDQVPVLGNIPGLGFFFRRQATSRSRTELVVIVRPYVFNTPTESAATSELLLGEISTHPDAANVSDSMNRKLPFTVTRADAECNQRAKLFKFHSGAPITP